MKPKNHKQIEKLAGFAGKTAIAAAMAALIHCGGAFVTTAQVIEEKGASAQEVPQLAVNSYSFKTAVGLRAGGTSGITIKQFAGSSSAFEGILGFWRNGLSVTALYERYAGTGVDGLSWYYGAGGHGVFVVGNPYYHYHGDFWHRHYDDGVGLGVDGIIGLEYKIRPIPFALSVDMKPFFEVTTAGHAHMSLDPGLGVKVTF